MMNSLRDLLIHELKDLYNAEKQLTKALPKLAKAATNIELKEAFTSHLNETEGHVRRLERALTMLDHTPRGTKCEAMEGLIEEGSKFLKDKVEPHVLDAALIAAAQRVEHYEMAGYGCAHAFAEQLGEDSVGKLLEETLDEESAANKTLNRIAMDGVNAEAMNGGTN